MNQLLHVSSAAVKETDDGNVETITLGAVSANAAELIPLVGEEVILQTPERQGRSFHGTLRALLIKDSKHGPEVSLKVAGGTELNGLVGTNVTVEAAQIALLPVDPVPAVPGRPDLLDGNRTLLDQKAHGTLRTASVTLKAKDEIANLAPGEGDIVPGVTNEALAKAIATDDLENF